MLAHMRKHFIVKSTEPLDLRAMQEEDADSKLNNTLWTRIALGLPDNWILRPVSIQRPSCLEKGFHYKDDMV